MCYVDATGGITIGNDVSIAHGVTIMSTTHTHGRDDLPIKYQPVELKETVIGDNCWIGAQSVILAGVTIGDGCVVAANSVVNRDVPPGSIVAGSPGKVVKKRG
jgi:acetyltransferase-like isoleucine patch superfamily enzyme